MNQEQIKKHIVDEIMPQEIQDIHIEPEGAYCVEFADGWNNSLVETHAKIDDIIQYVRGEMASKIATDLKTWIDEAEINLKESEGEDAEITKDYKLAFTQIIEMINTLSTNQK